MQTNIELSMSDYEFVYQNPFVLTRTDMAKV
jgi:hypothetical protein